MRKALGLLGEASRQRPDASEVQGRMGDRFNGGLHRRRFIQDGEVPVTVLRRDQGHDAPVHRSAAAVTAPTSSRLQRTEAALAAETAAREKVERALTESQTLLRDLQTKIGHAELAKHEALEALRREREAMAAYRISVETRQEQAVVAAAQDYADQLHDERQARKAAERALRHAEVARDTAEQVVRALSQAPLEGVGHRPPPQPAQAETSRRHMPEIEQPSRLAEPELVTAGRRGRAIADPPAEPEPVKWWLNTKPGPKRR